MTTINVNGKTLQTTHQTVQLVVNELGLSHGRYAVEVNGDEALEGTEVDDEGLRSGVFLFSEDAKG